MANISQPLKVKMKIDPLDALQLGVHEEGPALRVAQDGGILCGHAVAGEPLVVPSGHVCIVGQQAQGIQTFCERDGDLPRGQCGLTHHSAESGSPSNTWAAGLRGGRQPCIRITLRSSLEPGQKGCRRRPRRATVYILSGWSLHCRNKGAIWLGLPCRRPPQRS